MLAAMRAHGPVEVVLLVADEVDAPPGPLGLQYPVAYFGSSERSLAFHPRLPLTTVLHRDHTSAGHSAGRCRSCRSHRSTVPADGFGFPGRECRGTGGVRQFRD